MKKTKEKSTEKEEEITESQEELTKLSDLKETRGNVNAEFTVISIGESRTTNWGEVATAVIEDDSGRCDLSLWKEDIKRFETGDVVRLINGYFKVTRGTEQTFKNLSAGRYGKFEKVEDE